MRRAGVFAVLVVSICGLLLLPGCGDGDPADGSPSSSVDVTGEWSVTVIMIATVTDPDSMRWHLTQSGTAVTGTFEERNGHHGEMMDGTVAGRVVSFRMRYTCHANEPIWYVSCAVDGDTMTGKYRPVDGPEGTGVNLTARRL